jgi:Lon-like ATP-dependent protease
LINAQSEYILTDDIPGIRIYRSAGEKEPFDIFFCKTKYNAYQILMGLNKKAVETLMAQRSRSDLEFMRNTGNSADQAGQAI